MTKTTKGMIIVALLLFAGATTWLLYNRLDDEPATDNSTTQQTSEPTQLSEPEPSSQVYSGAALDISFEYPLDWQTLECDGVAEEFTTAYLASDDRGLGIQDDGSSILCSGGSDFAPQAAIFSRESIDVPTGDMETVIVSGVEAKKYVSVEGSDGELRPEGFTTVTYVIPRRDSSQKIIAVYNQWPDSSEGYDTSDVSRGVFESIIETSLELE